MHRLRTLGVLKLLCDSCLWYDMLTPSMPVSTYLQQQAAAGNQQKAGAPVQASIAKTPRATEEVCRATEQ